MMRFPAGNLQPGRICDLFRGFCIIAKRRPDNANRFLDFCDRIVMDAAGTQIERLKAAGFGYIAADLPSQPLDIFCRAIARESVEQPVKRVPRKGA
jgi:hypothetical protein